MVESPGESITLAFVLNHPFYRVDGCHYAVTPNILDLMLAFRRQVDRVVLCGPAKQAGKVEPRWQPVPPELEVFELPFYADNLDLLRRAPVLLVALLRRIIPVLQTWDIVAGVAPSGFGLMTVMIALSRRRMGFLYVRGNQIVSLGNIYGRSPWNRRLIVASFWPLEIAVRLCSRFGVLTFVKGEALAERYRGPRVHALEGYARPSVVNPPLSESIHDSEALRQLLFVGRLSAEKGADLLLRAIPMVNRLGYSCRLLVAGDGPDAPQLADLARELDIESAVSFAGYVLDPGRLREMYLGAGIVVVPSRSEGVPVALIDAMALGRAVIATRAGGIPTVVRDGVNGLLVPAGDPEALAKSICRLLDDPSLAFRLAAAAAVTGRSLTVDAQAEQMIREVRARGRARHGSVDPDQGAHSSKPVQ